MNKLPLISLVFLLFWNCFDSSAQNDTKTVFSLREAQEYAVKNSYSVKTSNLDLDLAKKTVALNGTLGLPHINGKVDYMHYFKGPVTPVEAGKFNPFAPNPDSLIALSFVWPNNSTAGFTVGQLLFDYSYIISMKATKLFVELSKDNVKKSEIDIKDGVSQIYYSVLIAQENKRLLNEGLKNLNKTLFETTQLNKNGFAEDLAVDQLNLLISTMNNNIAKLDRAVESMMGMLKLQMGFDINKPIELSENIESLFKQTNPESLMAIKFDINKHIGFQLASHQENFQKELLRKEKVSFIPTLTSFINYQKQAFRNTFDFTHTDLKWYTSSGFGLSLAIPIMDGGMKSIKIKQAKLEVEKAKVMKQQVSQGLELQAQTAKADYASALEVYKSEEQNLSLAQKIRNTTLTKFNEGLTSSMELTQAENQLLTTQGNYINSLLGIMNAKSKLDKALNNY